MRNYKPNHLVPLYHISVENHDGELFVPRVPYGAKEWGEDYITKRICVSTSIVGCIRAVDPCMWCPRVDWYVHIPYNTEELYERGSVVVPSEKEVGDVMITREKWITEPVKMKCIGIIHSCSGIYHKGSKFKWVKRF